MTACKCATLPLVFDLFDSNIIRPSCTHAQDGIKKNTERIPGNATSWSWIIIYYNNV